jgi:hypothetical protein
MKLTEKNTELHRQEIEKLSILKTRVENSLCIIDLSSECRDNKFVVGRCLYYSIAEMITGISQKETANYINREHGAAINSKRKLSEYLKINPLYRNTYDNLCIEYNIATEEQIERATGVRQAKLLAERESKFKQGLDFDFAMYSDLINLIQKVPAKHVETVKTRLTPIVNMLPA